MNTLKDAVPEIPLSRNTISLGGEGSFYGFSSVEVNGDGRIVKYVHMQPSRSISLGDSVVISSDINGYTGGPLEDWDEAIVVDMLFPDNQVPTRSDGTDHVFVVTGVVKGKLTSQRIKPGRIANVIPSVPDAPAQQEYVNQAVRNLLDTPSR